MGGGGGQQQAAPVAAAPAPIVYQSLDPYAPNYQPPSGLQTNPAPAPAAPPAPLSVETPEQRASRLRNQALIVGADLGGSAGGTGDGSGRLSNEVHLSGDGDYRSGPSRSRYTASGG